jgi:NADPH:quinone reductase-like Zn-dependent oxidoreductase
MTGMSGVRLPGDRTVEHARVDVPQPGHGQVLPRTRASSIGGR